MDKTALAAAVAAATLAISTAGAEGLPPPMGIMSPYDTPAMAAERITMPADVGALGAQRGETGLENARASPGEGRGLLDLPAGLGTADALELARGGDGDGDSVDKPDKPDKPAKPEKPEKPEKPDDDDDG